MTTKAVDRAAGRSVSHQTMLSTNLHEWLAGYGFVTPALIVVLVFVFIPMIYAFFISFTNWTGLQPPREAQYVQFQNYQDLLTNEGFIRTNFFTAIKNTVY